MFDAKTFIEDVVENREHIRTYEVWCGVDELGPIVETISDLEGIRLNSIKIQAYKPWAEPKKPRRPVEYGVRWEVAVNGTAEDAK